MNPQKIAVLTDSCADISPALIRERNIFVLPLKIIYPDREYSDGVDITPQEIYQRMPQALPTTSLPDGGTLLSLLDEIKSQGFEKVIAICLSAGLSGTYNMVRLMAENYEGLQCAVFDSNSGSLGEGCLALEVTNRLAQGASWEELLNLVPRLREKTQVMFSLDTLEYLQKGGRIGKISCIAGTMLQIKPIITFAPDGQLQSVAKVRGRHQVMRKLVDMAVDRCGEHKRYNLAVAHGGAPEEMETVRQMLTEALPNSDHLWDGEIDGTLSVYIGDGVLGAAVQVLD